MNFKQLLGPAIAATFSAGMIFAVGLFSGSTMIDLFGTPVDKAIKILRSDEQYGWRQRENLNTQFYETSVVTNQDGFRVKTPRDSLKSSKKIFFGPSSTFGWGVELDETYSRNSANYGQIGFSSNQGNLLLRKILSSNEIRPSHVYLAYGVNDLDRFRFFYQSLTPDEVGLNNIPSSYHLQATIEGIPIFRIILKGLSNLKSSLVGCGVSQIPPLRVAISEYIQNTKAMIEFAQSKGARVVLVNTPYRILRELELKSEGPVENESERLYAKSVSLNEKGYCKEAHQAFLKANQFEPYRVVRDVLNLNQELSKIGREMGLSVVDSYAALNVIGNMAYVDPAHPSKIGHFRISELIESLE